MQLKQNFITWLAHKDMKNLFDTNSDDKTLD